MKTITKKCIAGAFVALTLGTLSISAFAGKARPTGSFLQSCKLKAAADKGNKLVLVYDCKKKDGHWKRNRIESYTGHSNFNNYDGNLVAGN